MEAAYVGLFSEWSNRAREYAGPNPLRHSLQLVVGALAGAILAAFVLRGRRWAWRIALVWSALLGGLSLISLGGALVGFHESVGGPPLEIAIAVPSVLFLIASFAHLAGGDARAYLEQHSRRW